MKTIICGDIRISMHEYVSFRLWEWPESSFKHGKVTFIRPEKSKPHMKTEIVYVLYVDVDRGERYIVDVFEDGTADPQVKACYKGTWKAVA
jgi:hypothetical protein